MTKISWVDKYMTDDRWKLMYGFVDVLVELKVVDSDGWEELIWGPN